MALSVNDGIVRTEKDVAGIVDLTDHEIAQMFKIVTEISRKFKTKPNTPNNLQAEEDELKTRLMDIGILVAWDPTPTLQGGDPILEIVGKVSTDSLHKHGFDHELKKEEVLQANSRGEAWYGQKESTNQKSKAAKRERNRKENLRKLQDPEKDK